MKPLIEVSETEIVIATNGKRSPNIKDCINAVLAKLKPGYEVREAFGMWWLRTSQGYAVKFENEMTISRLPDIY